MAGSVSMSFSGNRSRKYQKAHCKEDQIYVFPEMKLRGLVPDFHIHAAK
jgi:hypothetical protein